MNKKQIFIIPLIFTIIITILSSCNKINTDFEKQQNYGPTVDFFYSPTNNDYPIYRGVYDQSKNIVLTTDRDNIIEGGSRTFYIDSEYKDQVFDIAAENKLGQLNDYRRFEDAEIYLYWEVLLKNTIVIVKDGNIKPIEIANTIDLTFLCYDGQFLYLEDFIGWKNNYTEYRGKIYKIDLTTYDVNEKEICIYDDNIESRFKINDKMKYSVPEWADKNLSGARIAATIPKQDRLVLCVMSSPFIEELENYAHTCWIIEYNFETNTIENLAVYDSAVCGFRKIGSNYFAFFYTFKNGTNFGNTYIDKLWMSVLDENFKEISKTEINDQQIYTFNNIGASISDDKAFIFGSIRSDYTKALMIYDIETGDIEFAKDMPKGRFYDARLIQKTNGVIYNIQNFN